MEALCRICYEEGELRRPCRCRGSVGSVHEACLAQWIDGREERERCELCGMAYRYVYDRSLEFESRANALCESIWGNIGTHIAIQYGAVLVWGGVFLRGSPIPFEVIVVAQGIYHCTVLCIFGWIVKEHLQSPVHLYLGELVRLKEAVVCLGLYLGLWGCLLGGFGFQMVTTVSLQTFPPLFLSFHRKILASMNRGRRRQLLDWEEI